MDDNAEKTYASDNNRSNGQLLSPANVLITRPRSLHRKVICAITHSRPWVKCAVAVAIVLVGSTLQALGLSPGTDTVFADNRNLINIYFVKFSWAWTLLCILPTVTVVSALYTGLNFWEMVRHLSRVGVAHTIWYFLTSLFEKIDHRIGICSDVSFNSPKACAKTGNVWNGFDISGHVFLLTFCILLLTEEVANIKLELWREYGKTLTSDHRVTNKLPPKLKQSLTMLYQNLTFPMSLLELLATAEVLLWLFMLCTSSLYFHTLIEKVLGTAIAISAWFLTYRVFYGSAFWSPAKPSEGRLDPNRLLNL